MRKPFSSLLYSRHTGKPGPETLVGPYENRKTGTLGDPRGTLEKLEKQELWP